MTKKNLKLASLFFLFLFVAGTATFALPSIKANGGFVIKRGTNLSHWLSLSEARGEARRNYFTDNDVRFPAVLGFDPIRIPVDYMQLTLEKGQQNQESFALLKQALNRCKK